VIAHLSGVVRRSAHDYVVLDVGGVGYMVSVGSGTRQRVPAPGGAMDLHIHTHVREDQLALYGFATAEELDLFEMLIQVDGVGPKVGLNILSAASIEVLKRAITSEDPAPILGLAERYSQQQERRSQERGRIDSQRRRLAHGGAGWPDTTRPSSSRAGW